eukprot:352231-Chlamydomonas_euryale.AAC.3
MYATECLDCSGLRSWIALIRASTRAWAAQSGFQLVCEHTTSIGRREVARHATLTQHATVARHATVTRHATLMRHATATNCRVQAKRGGRNAAGDEARAAHDQGRRAPNRAKTEIRHARTAAIASDIAPRRRDSRCAALNMRCRQGITCTHSLCLPVLGAAPPSEVGALACCCQEHSLSGEL